MNSDKRSTYDPTKSTTTKTTDTYTDTDTERDDIVRDEYGFQVEEELEEYFKYEKKRQAYEDKYAKKWEDMFLKFKRRDDELFSSAIFKKLVGKGIPVQYRGFVWYTFSGAAARANKANTGEESNTGTGSLSRSSSVSSTGTPTLKRPTKAPRANKVSYYQNLQRQLRNLTTGSRRISAALEIEKDLRRTFPGHALFESEDGKSILRRILLAYALRNPHVGYCQSMNVLAAFILLVTQPSRQHQYHADSTDSANTSNPTSTSQAEHSSHISDVPSNKEAHPFQPQQTPSQSQAQSHPQSFRPQSQHNLRTSQNNRKHQSSLPVNLAEQWEERAFWILVEMIEGRCVDYYTRTLRGSQIDLRVLAQVLALHLPALTTHFETLGLSLPLLATRWFMCVFALVLPVDTALHIWDQVLVHTQLVGHDTSQVARDYIVLFAAALLQCSQDAILAKGERDSSVSDIVLLLDRVPRLLYNKKELNLHYKSMSFRLPPGGVIMTKLRQSATEYVDAETKDIKRARDLMQAARQTKFSSIELSHIHAMLFKSAATSRSDRGSISVGSEGFQNILSHMVPGIAQSPAIHRLFKALDQNNDNKLDFREMICGLSILAKGTLDEKLELLFKSFDVDNTGFITQAQLEALITSVSSQMDPDNPEKYSNMGSGVVGTDPLGVRVVSVSTFVEQVFAHLCITTGKLSLDQFRQAVIAEPRLIECLMIGNDEDDINLSVNQPDTHHAAIETNLKTGSNKRSDDGDLPLGVNNATNQTPLLQDTDDENVVTSTEKQPCCTLL